MNSILGLGFIVEATLELGLDWLQLLLMKHDMTKFPTCLA
jgi:hypothetical protein